MLDIFFYQYKNEILKKRPNYIKLSTVDKIAEVVLFTGASMIVLATILDLVFTLVKISLCVMLAGLLVALVGVVLIIIITQNYFKHPRNIIQEKIWERERIRELRECLDKNFQIQNHEKTLQFLIDECEQKKEVSSEKVLFGGACGYFLGILSSMLNAMIEDISKNVEEGQRWQLYIVIIIFITLIIIGIYTFGFLINSFRERRINVLNSLQSDLKYILSTIKACQKTDERPLDRAGNGTHRKGTRKKR